METAPSSTGAKNGPQMARKWSQEWKTPRISISWPFFAPVRLGAVSIWFSIFFFSHFRLLAVFHAMPAQHDPNPCTPDATNQRASIVLGLHFPFAR